MKINATFLMQRKGKYGQVATFAVATRGKLDKLIRASMYYALENDAVPYQEKCCYGFGC